MPNIGNADQKDGPEIRLEYVTWKSGDGERASRRAPYGMADLTVARGWSWAGS